MLFHCYAQLHVHGEIVAEFLTHGVQAGLPVDKHLPEDVRVVGAYTVGEGLIGLILESRSFPITLPGTPAERLPILEAVRFRARPSRALSALPSAN